MFRRPLALQYMLATAIIVGLAIVVGIFRANAPAQTLDLAREDLGAPADPTPAGTDQPPEYDVYAPSMSAHWSTFREEDYGFEISNPGGWKVAEPDVYPGWYYLTLRSDRGVKVEILPRGGADYGLPWEEPQLSDISLNGHAATRTDWTTPNAQITRIKIPSWHSSARIDVIHPVTSEVDREDQRAAVDALIDSLQFFPIEGAP